MPSWSWSLVVLAVGLSMDAMAVAAARGLAAREHAVRDGVVLSVAFGVFQGGMPGIGWALGALLGRWIEAWDHWVAFALLCLLGAKMLHESRGEPDLEAAAKPLAAGMVLSLAVATSVDALAAGITLPTLGAPLGWSLLTIGLTTSLLSAIGFAAGRRAGAMLGRRLDAFGGIVLIGLGTKILAEHLGWLG